MVNDFAEHYFLASVEHLKVKISPAFFVKTTIIRKRSHTVHCDTCGIEH
ncbi:hypothetical protein PLEI_0267 [Photobacterium leiognathi lrivu.4.1]|uniref:Transposase n=1 Tax=Photobacterium leiognathi lrivu.4.1 TaxID=1248232 RepID=V5EMQ9_PHOLE|nr:hypothetical protein PLEI_0267 [Photobacterium leiognathi lrivu.4.1]